LEDVGEIPGKQFFDSVDRVLGDAGQDLAKISFRGHSIRLPKAPPTRASWKSSQTASVREEPWKRSFAIGQDPRTNTHGRQSSSTKIKLREASSSQQIRPSHVNMGRPHAYLHLALRDVMPTAGLCRAVDAGYGPGCFVISGTRHNSYGLFMLASMPVKERANEHNYLGRWGASEVVRRAC